MIEEEAIKNAFERVKQDIFSIGSELDNLKNELFELKQQISSINEVIDNIKIDILELKNAEIPLKYAKYATLSIPTDEAKKPTISAIPTDNPTVPYEARGLKHLNLGVSIGNGGVPTDRQTDQQTDRQTQKLIKSIDNASQILASLDAIKKEIRLKFKQITQQEMLVFSTIYQLEEMDSFGAGVDYKQIALKLRLSESSIRDYTQKLINKGIPIHKTRVNNKKITLKIDTKLKEIASLQTILKLREI